MIRQNRKAFSMLTALVVIVTMAVIASYVMGTAGKIVKNTTDQYRKEQAMFYAKSYTEYAIMAVSAATGDCLEDIDAVLGTTNANRGIGDNVNHRTGYDVEIRLSYIGSGGMLGQCAGTRILSDTVQDQETSLNIMVDAYVRYRDLNDMNKILSYHRRSLQKI